jgi:hypothetical protein
MEQQQQLRQLRTTEQQTTEQQMLRAQDSSVWNMNNGQWGSSEQ